jgi:hypothetical protein
MNNSTHKTTADRSAPAAGTGKSGRRSRPAELQPQATGANKGSPAAPVMKQFAKTQAESTGKSKARS